MVVLTTAKSDKHIWENGAKVLNLKQVMNFFIFLSLSDFQRFFPYATKVCGRGENKEEIAEAKVSSPIHPYEDEMEFRSCFRFEPPRCPQSLLVENKNIIFHDGFKNQFGKVFRFVELRSSRLRYRTADPSSCSTMCSVWNPIRRGK